MALFGSKKNKEVKTVSTAKEKAVKAVKSPKALSAQVGKVAKSAKVVAVVAEKTSGSFVSNTSSSILRPRITEKSGLLSQSGVYTFEVTKNSNKAEIGSAIRTLYKVTPVKVAIVNLPPRKVFVRGRRGVVPGVRKALVTLRKGDKIDFV